MKSFINICEDTKEKLGRQLEEKEKDFLAWMFNRHQDEKKLESKHLSVYKKVKKEKKLQY